MQFPYRKLLMFLITIAAIITVSHIPQVKDSLAFSRLHDISASVSEIANKPWGPPLFVLISAVVLLLHIPEIIAIVLGGMIYEFWLAFILSWVGCGLGTTCSFLIARFFLQDFFKPRIEKSFLRKFNDRLEKDGIATICLLRMILFLFPPLNWAIGATGIRTRDYIIGNFLGIAPGLLAVLLAVTKLKQINSLSDIFQPESIALVGAFIGAFLVIVYIRKKYFLSDPE